MTQSDFKKLHDKVTLLEAKATIMLQEALEIRVLLEDILDPENKKAKRAFERARKKAEAEAMEQAFRAEIRRKLRGEYGSQSVAPPGTKPGTRYKK